MKAVHFGVALLLTTGLLGCGPSGIGFVEKKNSEPLVPEAGDGYLMFDLELLSRSGAALRYDCKFYGEGKLAHFQFEVTIQTPSGGPPATFTSGKIVAVAGSDASDFLHKLQKTLQAKTFPTPIKRVSELPFTAVILGSDNSHARDGQGFFTKPPGNWTAMKIFIGNRDDPSEVFLNFNPVLRKGEFSIKDPDYGDEVLKLLATVL